MASTRILPSPPNQGNVGSWREVRVSDASWTGNPPAPDYDAGDHVGLAARNGVAYPVWSDDRGQTPGAGEFRAYTSRVQLFDIYDAPTESPFVAVVSYSCNSPTITFDVAWQTSLSSDGVDELEIYPPNQTTPFVQTAVSQGRQHRVIWHGTCQANTSVPWTYRVRSTRGALTATSCVEVEARHSMRVLPAAMQIGGRRRRGGRQGTRAGRNHNRRHRSRDRFRPPSGEAIRHAPPARRALRSKKSARVKASGSGSSVRSMLYTPWRRAPASRLSIHWRSIVPHRRH